MAKKNETVKTVVVSGLLCAVCSVLVSATAVGLKPLQLKNKDLDMKKNILMSAGLLDEGQDVMETFGKVETLIVNLETGEKSDVDPKSFDPSKAEVIDIPGDKDIAGLSTRTKLTRIYLTRSDDGKVKELILPIVSKGLWSTMYGFMALKGDMNTIKGFAYYAQGETPGLGGEVDNPSWKKQWLGKRLYDEAGTLKFLIQKGGVSAGDPQAGYKVDGLSGATLTGNGVQRSIQYWFGNHGYEKLLNNVKAGRI